MGNDDRNFTRIEVSYRVLDNNPSSKEAIIDKSTPTPKDANLTNDQLLELYKIYYDRLKKEGDWIYERLKLHVQILTALLVAVGAIYYSFFTGTADPINRLFLLCLNSIVIWMILLVNTICGRIASDGTHWQQFFTIKMAQMESDLGLANSVGLAESILRTVRIPRKALLEVVTISDVSDSSHAVSALRKAPQSPDSLLAHKKIGDVMRIILSVAPWSIALWALLLVLHGLLMVSYVAEHGYEISRRWDLAFHTLTQWRLAPLP